ncbi:MAG TPA: hypothetical protein PLG77_06565 [Burkholderiaceae bacterium]|nr:hypothetical protein [Burkholderiaceae bacterium]
MQSRFIRLLAASALAIFVAGGVGGCEDYSVEVTGIGASVGLPGNTMTGSNEIGVGNVEWVGNPRW